MEWQMVGVLIGAMVAVVATVGGLFIRWTGQLIDLMRADISDVRADMRRLDDKLDRVMERLGVLEGR